MAHNFSSTKVKYVTENGYGYNLSETLPNLALLPDGTGVNFTGHRNPVRIEMRETNHFLASDRIQAGGICKIWINDYQVYKFEYQDTTLGLVKLVQVLDRIRHFPVPLNGRDDCEKLINRPVWYREMPALLTDFDGERGQILVQADNIETRFVAEPWSDADEGSDAQVRVDLLSPQIYWFRLEG